MGYVSEQPSRLELARRRLRTAQLVACAGSATAFVALLLAVRAAHPAHAGTASSSSTGGSASTQDDGSFGFGPGSVGSGSFGPGGGSAQVQTGGS